jgi:hypothetical protein
MLAIGLTQSNDLNLRFRLAFDLHDHDHTDTSKDFFNLFLSFKKIILIFSGYTVKPL